MDAAAPVVHVIDNGAGAPSETMLELQSLHTFSLDHLYEHYGVTRDAIEALFDCAKFRFDCGEYDVAAFYLGVYRDLVPTESGAGGDRSLKALWGRFAGHMLATAWEEADKDRELLRGVLAKTRMPELESLQQRTWLLHWSLFVFANHPKGKDNLVEFFLQDSHVNAMQLNAPWLLRYVCAVVLTNKKRQNYMRQILRIISQEGASYNDPVGGRRARGVAPIAAHRGRASPRRRRCGGRVFYFPNLPLPSLSPSPSPRVAAQITQFVERLLIHFDFEGAQERLAECESVIVTDFFLSYLTTPRAFMEAARLFIFETYCRIHQKIDLPTLAARLHMDEPGAEAWVVDLIRNASLDAKIDSIGRQVIMTVPAASVYQLVIDKTRELTARTRALHDNIEGAS